MYFRQIILEEELEQTPSTADWSGDCSGQRGEMVGVWCGLAEAGGVKTKGTHLSDR